MEKFGCETRQTTPALPCSALRLVVPPLRLMSAFLWQVVQRHNVTQYEKLEQFVVLVSETVPDIMSRNLLNKLVFCLRKKVILELCLKDGTPDRWVLQAHLDSLHNLTRKCKDMESQITNTKFINTIHSILEDSSRRENFQQNVLPVEYGSAYDAVLQSLAWRFLSRVDELLPVPNLKETVSWLCGGLSAMDDIVQPLSDPAELKDVLRHFKAKMHSGHRETLPVGPSETLEGHAAAPACGVPQDRVPSPSSVAQETIVVTETPNEYQSESERAAATIMSPAHSDAEEVESVSGVGALGTPVVETELQEEEVYQEEGAGTCEVQQIYLTADGSAVIVSELDGAEDDAAQLRFLEPPEETAEVREISMEEWLSEMAGKVIPVSVVPPSGSEEAVAEETVAEETAYVSCVERLPSIKAIINRKSPPSDSRQVSAPAESPSPEERKHVCRLCEKEFRYECQLRNHLRAHTGERPFQCTDCGKSFRCLSFLSTHLKTHSLTRPFKCPQCGKTFRKKADLLKHVRVHTGEKPFQCTICGKSFSQGSYLKIHLECHTSERPHRCPHCEKSFPTPFKLAIHIRYHSMARAYACNVCGKSFIYASLLRRHKGYHAGERQYLCSICGKSFVYMFDLKKHQRNHDKPRVRIPCAICHKTFAGPEMLRCHLRIHTGERPFACKQCGKTFSQIGNMKRHERVHTGERPYPCATCGKTYKHSSHLKNHMLNHTGERPWRCAHCGKTFKFLRPLKKHEATHLGERRGGEQAIGRKRTERESL